jgi:hypothetical protein
MSTPYLHGEATEPFGALGKETPTSRFIGLQLISHAMDCVQATGPVVTAKREALQHPVDSCGTQAIATL